MPDILPENSGGELAAPYAVPFTLVLYQALVEQLPIALDALHTAPLTSENIASLGSARGIYQLWLKGEARYFGKSESTLAERLDQHRKRCLGRTGLEVADMSFKCLFLDRFVDAAAPEQLLIRHYQNLGQGDWNLSVGFGPKDVGHGRDSGEPGSWFSTYPPDYETPVDFLFSGRAPLLAAITAAKTAIPFLFRYASNRSRSPKDQESAKEYAGRFVELPPGPHSPLEILKYITGALPIGWQATVLPHAAILYKETFHYESRLAGWRSTGNGAVPL